MSLVCSENIVNYCLIDQSLPLGKMKFPVSVDSIGGDQKSTAGEKTESTDLDQLSIVTQSLGRLNLQASTKRIQASCEIIWGTGDYDIDIETDDWISYMAIVKRDFGTSLGPPLTMTGLCRSSDHACRELDRMLGVWARQI